QEAVAVAEGIGVTVLVVNGDQLAELIIVKGPREVAEGGDRAVARDDALLLEKVRWIATRIVRIGPIEPMPSSRVETAGNADRFRHVLERPPMVPIRILCDRLSNRPVGIEVAMILDPRVSIRVIRGGKIGVSVINLLQLDARREHLGQVCRAQAVTVVLD